MVDYKALKDELDSCKNPLFFFHDDTDGLCSFLQLYKYKKEGHWCIVKARPVLDEKFLPKVKEYDPDKIFVLDIAEIGQDFIDAVHCQIIWVDHHEPSEHDKVKQFNPRRDAPPQNIPTTLLCYNAVKEDAIGQIIQWIALVGSVADWHMPSWASEFSKHHPELLDKSITKPEDALFTSPIGKLARILQFVGKGQMPDVKKSISALLKIQTPEEILSQTTETGKYLYKRFEHLNKEYGDLWHALEKAKGTDKLLVFTYTENKTSFTGELATEAIYRHPEKIVIVCREKSGEMRCSLRSATVQISPILKKVLLSVQGYGGGHEYACGAGIKKEDFSRFVELIREHL